MTSKISQDTDGLTPTGFPRLDRALGGGLYGYHVLCAGNKSLKTTFLTSVAYQMVVRGDAGPIDFYCQMGGRVIFRRLLLRWILEQWMPENSDASHHSLDEEVLVQQPFFKEAWFAAMDIFNGCGFRVIERLGLDEMRAEIREMAETKSVRNIIVDDVDHLEDPEIVHDAMSEVSAMESVRILSSSSPRGLTTYGSQALCYPCSVMKLNTVRIPLDRPEGLPDQWAWLDILTNRRGDEFRIGGDGLINSDTGLRRPLPAYSLEGGMAPHLLEYEV
jgi:hypothetical protein